MKAAPVRYQALGRDRMLLIECPWCGPRNQIEFEYVGPLLKRPDRQVSVSEWVAFVYQRKNPKGDYDELWQHCGGCREFVTVRRNTITNDLVTIGERVGS